MKSAHKAFLVSGVIALISCMMNPNLGKLFGFTIPAYSAWFDAGFIISSFLFFLCAAQLVSEEEDCMETWLFLFGLGAIISSLAVTGQNAFGGNFVLPFFYILSLICSVMTIIFFFSEGIYDDPKWFFVYLAAFSGPVFAMGLFVPIIPLMTVFLVPYLLFGSFTLFFLNISKISKWITHD
ncbi:MAG: hypothetical protein WC842_04235 [Candidatus Paceibacterota bacterium]|jgi:hypothetical protein